MPVVDERKKALVMQALEKNPKYIWRTIAGVAEETGLEVRTIKDIIAAAENEIIRSKVPAADGQDLYTAAVREPTLIGRPSLWPLFLWRLDHHGRNGILGEQTVFDI